MIFPAIHLPASPAAGAPAVRGTATGAEAAVRTASANGALALTSLGRTTPGQRPAAQSLRVFQSAAPSHLECRDNLDLSIMSLNCPGGAAITRYLTQPCMEHNLIWHPA
jgi:hypothetical protein